MVKIKQSTKSKNDHHLKHQKQHRRIIGLGIIVIAVMVGLILMLTILPKIHNDARLKRINEIYSSITLPQNTFLPTTNIFGDKRPYDYDKSRSYSSQKKFVVAKTVAETFGGIDKAIKAAGYTQFEEAYPGATSKEFHYKTSRGEYIRLNVSSKLRNDAAINDQLMNGKFTETFFKIDPNAGPSTVTLKVNLDDNNE
jgi:hypothetical protein